MVGTPVHPSSSHLTLRNNSIIIFILEMRKPRHGKLIDVLAVSQLGSKLSEHSAARRKLACALASFLLGRRFGSELGPCL